MKRLMNGRKYSALLLIAAMILTLTACGSSSGDSSQEGTDGAVRDQDSVVIAIGSEPETLDPTQGWGHGNSPIVQSTLVTYTADLTFENDLAIDYILSDDGLTWTFTIRDDAYFTDGEKVTASDVAYSTATLGTTEVEGYHVEAITSADNRGFTLPVLPDEGEVTESGAPIGNNVTCNLEIRQAIAYAIDRQQIVEAVLNGFGRPAYSENDGMPWNNPEVVIETDVEYARSLLADAGWEDTDGDGIVEKDGLKAEFSCLYPAGDSVRQAVAMAAAEQVREIGIQINVEGTSWDEITQRMFSEAVMMGWGSSSPNETYYLYRSEGALLDDFYNPEGYASDVTDAYLDAAMEALTPGEANENWQKVQWDGTTGTAMQGECPWVWIVNLDHVTFVRDGLSIGEQPIHGHGHGLPLIQNLQDWSWSE